MLTYKIGEFRELLGKGSSQPLKGTLDAIFKGDCDEAPFTIYNEAVAQRLASVLGVPVAQGVMVASNRGLVFGSLVLAESGLPLPDIYPRNYKKVCKRYPELCAALCVLPSHCAAVASEPAHLCHRT